MMGVRGLVLGCLLAGCYSPQVATGVPCGEDGACPAGLACRDGRCELPDPLDASVLDVAIDACPAPRCEGAELVDCGVATSCPLGCDETGGAHCRQMVPANGLDPALLAGATADVMGGDWALDTETGRIGRGGTELRAAGTGVISGIGFQIVEGLGVFTANRFHLTSTSDWTATGDHPLVLYAATTIVLDKGAELDVGAYDHRGVAGGQDASTSTSAAGCRGRAGRFLAAGFAEGGGGAGGRDPGGDGAPSDDASPTGSGGTQCATPSTIPLRGGHAGGAGGADSACSGGGGGGGVALVAMAAIEVHGAVGAPGAGGESQATCDAGGGGGGGGAVLVEAPVVTVTGALTANGGGGGAPRGSNGNRGPLSTASMAAGGAFTGPGGTKRGGLGGAGTLDPTDGQTYLEIDAETSTTTIARGGGGGGSAGRVEVRALTADLTDAVVSPPPTTSTPELR